MRPVSIAVLALALLATACSGFIAVEKRPAPPPPAVREHVHHPAHLGVPPGHLPPPGQCRIWVPGRPPGHQPPPGRCSVLASQVPAGAWLLYRPTRDRHHVEVTVYDAVRPSVVVAVAIYESNSGRFVREGKASRTR